MTDTSARSPSREVEQAGRDGSPTPCPTCHFPTWDGLHANGHRACWMHEVEQ